MNARFGFLSTAVLSTAVLAWAAPARAQVAVDWDVSGSGTVGFTSNATGVPDPQTDEDASPEPDGFITIAPGFRLQMETKDATQTLTYGLGATLYFIHLETSTFSQALSYGLRSPVKEGLEVTFALTGSQATTSSFALLSNASAGQAQAAQAQDNVIMTGGAGFGLNAEVAENVSFYMATSGAYAQTIIADGDDSQTTIGSFSLGVSRSWQRDTLAFNQSNDLQWSPAQLVGSINADDSIELLHRARLDWSHQFTQDWTSDLAAGALVVYDLYALEAPEPQPSALGAIRYTAPRGNFSFTYSHDAAPNLLLRQITVNDTWTLAGLADLPRGWDIGGSGGVQLTQSILRSGGVGLPGLALLLDFAVGWLPSRGPMRVEARYQLAKQFSLSEDADEALFPDMTRHTVLLTTTFAYPRPPDIGGQQRGVILPPPTANVDMIGRQAPKSEHTIQEEHDKKPNEQHDEVERPPPGPND